MPSHLVNVVPNPRVRALADRLVAESLAATSADAILNHVDHIQELDGEVYALLGVLLTQIKARCKTGRPQMPLVFTEAERREANRRYCAGLRDDWTVNAWREYQRVSKRAGRARRLGRAA